MIWAGMIVHTALEAARAMLHALGKVPGPWGDPRDSFSHALGGIDCCIFLRRAWGTATGRGRPRRVWPS